MEKLGEGRCESGYHEYDSTDASCRLSLVKGQCHLQSHKEGDGNAESEQERSLSVLSQPHSMSRFGSASNDDCHHSRRDEEREDERLANEQQKGRARDACLFPDVLECDRPLSALEQGFRLSGREAEREEINSVAEVRAKKALSPFYQGLGSSPDCQREREHGGFVSVSQQDGDAAPYCEAGVWSSQFQEKGEEMEHDADEGKERDKEETSRDEGEEGTTDRRCVAQTRTTSKSDGQQTERTGEAWTRCKTDAADEAISTRRSDRYADQVGRQMTKEEKETQNKERPGADVEQGSTGTRTRDESREYKEGENWHSTITEEGNSAQEQKVRTSKDKETKRGNNETDRPARGREARLSKGAHVTCRREGHMGTSTRETRTGGEGGAPAFVAAGNAVQVNYSGTSRHEQRKLQESREDETDGEADNEAKREGSGQGRREQPDTEREDGQSGGRVQRKKRDGIEGGRTENVCLTTRSGSRLQLSRPRKTGSRIHDIYSAISSAGRGELPPPSRQAFSRDLGGAPIHCSSLFRSCAGGDRKTDKEWGPVPLLRLRRFRCLPHLSCLHRQAKKGEVRFRRSETGIGGPGSLPLSTASCFANHQASADASSFTCLPPAFSSASPSQLPEHRSTTIGREERRLGAPSCVLAGSSGEAKLGSCFLFLSSGSQEKARESWRCDSGKLTNPVGVSPLSSVPNAASYGTSKEGVTKLSEKEEEGGDDRKTEKGVKLRGLSEHAGSQQRTLPASRGGLNMGAPALASDRQQREAEIACLVAAKQQAVEQRQNLTPSTRMMLQTAAGEAVSSSLDSSSFGFPFSANLTPADAPVLPRTNRDVEENSEALLCRRNSLPNESGNSKAPARVPCPVGVRTRAAAVGGEYRNGERGPTEKEGTPAMNAKVTVGSIHSDCVPQSRDVLIDCAIVSTEERARSAGETWTTVASRRERRTLTIGSPAFSPDENEQPDDDRDVLLDLLHFTSKRRFLMNEAEAIIAARMSLRKMKRELPFLMRKILEERRTQNERVEARGRFLGGPAMRFQGTEVKEAQITEVRAVYKAGTRDSLCETARKPEHGDGSCCQCVSPAYGEAGESEGINERTEIKEETLFSPPRCRCWPEREVDTPLESNVTGQGEEEENTVFDQGDCQTAVSVPSDSSSAPRLCSSPWCSSRLPSPRSSTYCSLLSLGEKARIPRKGSWRPDQDDTALNKKSKREAELHRAFCTLLVGYGKWEAAHSLSVDEVEEVLCFALPYLSRPLCLFPSFLKRGQPQSVFVVSPRKTLTWNRRSYLPCDPSFVSFRSIFSFLSANLPKPLPRTVTPADLQLPALLPSLVSVSFCLFQKALFNPCRFSPQMKDGELRAAKEENEAETVLVEERIRSTCAIFRQRFIKMLSWRLNYENLLSLHVNFTDFCDLCKSKSPVFTAACFHLMRQESSKLAWPVVEALSTFEVLYAGWYVAQRVLHADGVCPQRLFCHSHHRRPSAAKGSIVHHLRHLGFRSLTVCCWNSRAKTREVAAGQHARIDLPLSYSMLNCSKADAADTALKRWRSDRMGTRLFGHQDRGRDRGTRVANSHTVLQSNGARGFEARGTAADGVTGRGNMRYAPQGAKDEAVRKREEAGSSTTADFVVSPEACSAKPTEELDTLSLCESDSSHCAEMFPSVRVRSGDEQERPSGEWKRDASGRAGRYEEEEVKETAKGDNAGDMELGSRRRKGAVGKLEIGGVDGCSCCAVELLTSLGVAELLSLLDQKRLKVLADAGLADEREREGGETQGFNDRRAESIALSREHNTELVRKVAECVEHLRQSGSFCLYPHSSHRDFL
ncbi:conserved hypothetical protein [Neospora caninum Liverpool]|uniref:Uncharacterized protein n=1 Tax=Neospora caninum (strain Liverpool) TaxID=572307 RepID=F0VF38_NEOCL|nr:conserved hypothetical protein [Neospora caninum Liverpool]CBZ52332.1 conserved hypothetical protein [Neospora caninum Liverpool]|eukprot:XP_003882364.1 conserved hypothetical protein [Neospora caninum Liverpool]